MADGINLELPRNGHYISTWTIVDPLTLEPVDITEETFQLDVRDVAGSSILLGSATLAVPNPITGAIDVRIDGEDFDSVGSQFETLYLAYDFRRIFPDGIREVPFRGQIILKPEVSK